MSGKQQTMQLHRAVTEDVAVEDNGDIFAPLRRLRDKYLTKYEKLNASIGKADPDAVQFYFRAASAVAALLPMEAQPEGEPCVVIE